MNKNLIFFGLVCIILLGSSAVLGQVLSINYPQPNQVISQTSRLPLNVSSDLGSSSCIFLVDGYSNTSVVCDGITTVNLPNADGEYLLTVIDQAGDSVTQHVYVSKPMGAMAIIIYLATFALMIWMIFLTFWILLKFAQSKVNIFHVMVCWGSYAIFLFFYQLALEYANVAFLISWFELTIQPLGWIMVVASLSFYLVNSMVNTLKTGKNCFAPGWEDHE